MKKFIITISREFGCNARELQEKQLLSWASNFMTRIW